MFYSHARALSEPARARAARTRRRGHAAGVPRAHRRGRGAPAARRARRAARARALRVRTPAPESARYAV